MSRQVQTKKPTSSQKKTDDLIKENKKADQLLGTQEDEIQINPPKKRKSQEEKEKKESPKKKPKKEEKKEKTKEEEKEKKKKENNEKKKEQSDYMTSKNIDEKYCIPKSQFKNILKEVIDEFKPNAKVTKSALDLLHEVSENELLNIFFITEKIAAHRKVQTIQAKDFKMAHLISKNHLNINIHEDELKYLKDEQ